MINQRLRFNQHIIANYVKQLHSEKEFWKSCN